VEREDSNRTVPGSKVKSGREPWSKHCTKRGVLQERTVTVKRAVTEPKREETLIPKLAHDGLSIGKETKSVKHISTENQNVFFPCFLLIFLLLFFFLSNFGAPKSFLYS
jgi:hypothetical protein